MEVSAGAQTGNIATWSSSQRRTSCDVPHGHETVSRAPQEHNQRHGMTKPQRKYDHQNERKVVLELWWIPRQVTATAHGEPRQSLTQDTTHRSGTRSWSHLVGASGTAAGVTALLGAPALAPAALSALTETVTDCPFVRPAKTSHFSRSEPPSGLTCALNSECTGSARGQALSARSLQPKRQKQESNDEPVMVQGLAGTVTLWPLEQVHL